MGTTTGHLILINTSRATLKLFAARIHNFRSIEDQTVNFDEGCIVLVGINESGKSNILRALHTLDPEVVVSKDDLRIERTHEEHVESGVIEFHFALHDGEIKDIFQKAKSSFHSSMLSLPLLSNGRKTITLFDFCRMIGSVSWEVSIEDNQRQMKFWRASDEWSIIPGWFRNGEKPMHVQLETGPKIIHPGIIAFNRSLMDAGSLVKLTVGDLENIIASSMYEIARQNLPKCIFWRYSDHNLLPSSISRDEFIANPDCCVPLKSMFELAGIRGQDAISKAFNEVKTQKPNRYLLLLQRVADAATAHVNKVWKDYKNVKIELRPNGDQLIPLILDNELPLDMASRSDGFKRFVSFLLVVSAKVRTTELKNILLLVDEPENALHPSGAKSLSQELVDIGANNVVVYSTHSIFMIDKKNIARHRIVRKENGVTVICKAEKSRMQDEEVLYAAIGYSIFESLKRKNVVFEGWRDKEIFRVICDHLLKADPELAASIAECGTVHAEGVKDVKNVAKFLELAARDCLIVSDGDRAAIEKRTEFLNDKGWGDWVTLPEVFGKAYIETGEDLLTVEALVRKGNVFAKTVPELRLLVPGDFRDEAPYWPVLQKWIAELKPEKKDRDEKLNHLKSALYQDLVMDDLREDAVALARYIAGRIG